MTDQAPSPTAEEVVAKLAEARRVLFARRVDFRSETVLGAIDQAASLIEDQGKEIERLTGELASEIEYRTGALSGARMRAEAAERSVAEALEREKGLRDHAEKLVAALYAISSMGYAGAPDIAMRKIAREALGVAEGGGDGG